MPVQRLNYEGKEVLTSSSRDASLVAIRLRDVSRAVSMIGLRPFAESIGIDEEIWDTPQEGGDEAMITLAGLRTLLQAIGSSKATGFLTWLEEAFPEDTGVSNVSDEALLPEMLHRVCEMRAEHPDIKLPEIAARLNMSERVAHGYVAYSDLLRQLR